LKEEEINKFKLHYNLSNEQPLIYIGNAHRLKGVYEVYESLKNTPYQLVMTGSTNRATDLPVKFLNLNRHDYLCLLQASDVVITFSTMVEGWNRIAHEALLCKTPVIGSGRGGMKELLEGAGQKIVTDKTKLLTTLEDVLKQKSHFAERGFEYVQKYNTAYFEKEWVHTVNNLIGE
jgi:glycosyltransferase involved in cell wall biosynthesis